MNHAERQLDDPFELREQMRVFAEAPAGAASLLVADHFDPVKAALPLPRHLVIKIIPATSLRRSKPAFAFQDQGEELVSSDAAVAKRQGAEFVGNHNLRMRVQECAVQAVATSGIADEHAISRDLAEQLLLSRRREAGPDILFAVIQGLRDRMIFDPDGQSS